MRRGERGAWQQRLLFQAGRSSKRPPSSLFHYYPRLQLRQQRKSDLGRQGLMSRTRSQRGSSPIRRKWPCLCWVIHVDFAMSALMSAPLGSRHHGFARRCRLSAIRVIVALRHILTRLGASLGVRELWVVDAVKLQTRIHRNPAAGACGSIVERLPSERLVPHDIPALAVTLSALDLR